MFQGSDCYVSGDGESRHLVRHDHLQWVCGFVVVALRPLADHEDLRGVDLGSGTGAATAASFVRAVLGAENGCDVVDTTVAAEAPSLEFRDLRRGREE